MDKALACHIGGRGSNLDKTKEVFFCLEKFKYVFLPLWYPTMCLLSLLMPHSYENMQKILAAPSVRQNTEISAMFGRETKFLNLQNI